MDGIVTWYRTDPRRLEKEVQIMTRRTRAELRESEGHIFWVEHLVSATGQPFALTIDYPDRFPYEMPRAYVLHPDVSRAPHRLGDGSLCLFHSPFACDPKVTALVVRNRAIVWFLAWEVWKATGEWMAPEH
jgi:hypothetical protein